jgi:MFS transporter, Spinster family, sphingosine-1-phosphate transporter
MNGTGASTTQYDAAFERKAWLLVGFTWIAYCLNYSDRQVIFSIFPILKSELKFTDAQLGLTGSVFLWVYGLCSPIAGQIGDRFSKKWLVAMSLLLWSGVTALTGAAHSPAMILTCRALTGVTESLFVPAAVALLANAHRPENRSRAFALYGTGQLAGIVLGGWYGGFMAQEFQWRFAFYSLGLIGILYCYPYFRFLKSFKEEVHVETRKSGSTLAVTALARIPTYLVLCVVSGIFNLSLWLLYTWLPNFLYEKFSLGLADAGYTATVYLQSASVAGMLAGAAAADYLYRWIKASRFWLILTGLLLSAPCVHLIGNSDSLLVTKLAAIAFGLSGGLAMANLYISSFEVVPANTRASAVAFMNLAGYLTSGFAPLVTGMWKQSIGIHRMMSYASVLMVAAALLLLAGIKFLFPADYKRVH